MDVSILAGVQIGEGCVIGAGAAVTNDLEPYSVAVGNPAKVVKPALMRVLFLQQRPCIRTLPAREASSRRSEHEGWRRT